MGFVKSFEDIMANTKATADFYDAEMLMVFWETKPEIIAKLIPPPLKPADAPIAMAFVANYPATNFDVTYKESALFIRAEYDGEEGNYCLAMPVTNDIAMAGGREIFGFPKKMATIHFEKKETAVHGWTERRGIRFMEVRAELNGKPNDPDAGTLLDNETGEEGIIKGVSYNFKHFPGPEPGTLDYDPRLVKQETLLKPKIMEIGEAEIIFSHSNYDPWIEVEVVKMIGGIYTVGDNSMLGGKVLAEVGLLEFSPYAFLKWDMA
ncbi:MAG: acetoacetate decarboxylase family protein [Thermodesulfobacteriota bacterium]